MTDDSSAQREQNSDTQNVMEMLNSFFLGVGLVRTMLHEVIEYWQPEIQWIRRYQEASKPLKEAGILPHRSTPWEVFTPERPDEFPGDVMNYYSHHWEQVESIFLFDVESYEISAEAKEAFKEALNCHRHGLYRSAVLTLLPALEMEFRTAAGIGPDGSATSLVELRDVARKVPFGVVWRPIGPLYMPEILNKHIYEKVRTAEAVEAFRSNPIPNRHAAIHGLVNYDTSLNSLNAIILADYVFFLISQLVRMSNSETDAS